MHPAIIFSIWIGFLFVVPFAIVFLSIIPLYLKDNTSAAMLSSPITLEYSITDATFAEGSLATARSVALQNQLSSAASSSVSFNITSAMIYNATSSTSRANGGELQQILRINGILYAQSNCSWICFKSAAKKFSKKICESDLSIGA